jgi:DNA polymerase-3 subunit gamma/tau
MSYLVLARKYRPQTFEAVVQQSHVTRTLGNAIAAGRVAHAILFSGPRGTGKTTIARILAKAMNCEQGPAATPCNACRSCVEITAGCASDVFEIDGASNNSVDQVRELRENLKYMPAHSRYKIYIIDEVHMLSLAAFNALLKTLEEPPDHILFMFATTEIQKIPITILSRCQRHDLRRIDGGGIVDHLAGICRKESVAVDEPSLHLIAREAAGSMRDALSLLDHVLACADGSVTVAMISDLLGVVDRGHLFDMAQAVLKKDIQQVLQGIDAAWRHGYEIKRFYSDLAGYFHSLSLIKLGEKAEALVDLPRQEIEQMKRQVESIPLSYLVQIVDLLFQAEPAIKLSSQPRLGLEMVFMKLFQTPPALPIDALIDHLDQLQSKMGQGREMAARIETPQREAPELRAAAEQTPPKAMMAVWKSVSDQIAQQKPSLAAFLKHCSLRPGGDDRVVLEIKGNAFALKNVNKHLKFLERLCGDACGRPISLEIVANLEDAAVKKAQKKKSSRLKQKALGHPLLMEALEVFDGRVVDIKGP